MLLFIFALRAEAEPFITAWKLKKNMSVHGYPVYEGADRALVISGVGKLNAAAATTLLLALYQLKNNQQLDDTLIINIGCCAAISSLPIGELLVVAKIVDAETGYSYYPDTAPTIKLVRGRLETRSRPVTPENCQNKVDFPQIYDMEAAGIAAGAKHFLGPHQLLLLKLVTDHGVTSAFDPQQIREQLQINLPLIEANIAHHTTWLTAGAFPFKQEREVALALAQSLSFSQEMTRQFLQLVYQARSAKLDISSILSPYQNLSVQSKAQSKQILKELQDVLTT